ncbi:MAG: 16S rRNA (cytosine(967)-C(5))-methyltransferase RsmB [Planctomycetia bacterium]|nr:16S rRNA (cytosine(967)-C(5))-methyltransferase RsmB [Planctomycetia bacterium]
MSQPDTAHPRSAAAREIAFDVLNRWKPRSPHAARLLEDWFGRASVSASERGLATELVHGVMRRRETLSALLKPHVNRPLAQVEHGALVLLWLGAYQQVMLSGIPEYAAVNETTELAKRCGKPQWTGFINAVLRSLGRSVNDEIVAEPRANAVPLTAHRYRVVGALVFPDPERDWPGYFASAFSFPHWLAGRWQQRFNRDEQMRLGFWFNTPAQLCLRVNTLRTTREALLESLAHAQISARAGNHPESIVFEESAFVQRLPGYDDGWFAVQDESAIAAGTLLDPSPGERVLDLCSAPGGKTAHLAALMHNHGRILATDVDDIRLQRVTETCRRLGVQIVETRKMPRDSTDLGHETFDRILLDVPCSNTGVLGKRPEARWRLRSEDLTELPAIQSRLLRTACDCLAPGGRIVYSTCSIEPEENRAVVQALLDERRELTLVHEQDHVPGQPADGGYQALLQTCRATPSPA